MKKTSTLWRTILAEIYGFEEIETFKADESASSTNLVDFG